MKTLLYFLTVVCACAQLSVTRPAYVASILKPTSAAGSPPAAPSGLRMDSTDSSGTLLKWTDNSADEASFRVQCNYYGNGWFDMPTDMFGSWINPTAADELYYFAAYGGGTDGTGTGLAGTQVECSFNKFRVRSENAYGNSAWTDELQIPPTVEITDAAASQFMDSIQISWSDTGEMETGVKVYRSTDGGMNYSLLTTLAAAATFYEDVDVLLSHDLGDLRYKVAVVNAGGDGPDSNVAAP